MYLQIANAIMALLLCYIIWKEGDKFRPSTILLCIILGSISVVLQTINLIES